MKRILTPALVSAKVKDCFNILPSAIENNPKEFYLL